MMMLMMMLILMMMMMVMVTDVVENDDSLNSTYLMSEMSELKYFDISSWSGTLTNFTHDHDALCVLMK